jgi:hypothetical protein
LSWFSGLGKFGPSSLAGRIGQGALSLAGRVQVDQRGALAVVTHPDHEFPGVRACVVRELVGGMTQVVNVDALQADRGRGGDRRHIGPA